MSWLKCMFVDISSTLNHVWHLNFIWRCSFWLNGWAGINYLRTSVQALSCVLAVCQIVIRNLWLDIFCEIPNPQTIKTASSINHQHNHVVEHFVWCFVISFCCGQRYRLLWWILILNWPFCHRGWWTVHNPAKPIQSDSITNIGPRHVTCPVSGVQASLLHLNVNRQKVTLT